jgi:hypothetical protein
MSHGVFLCVDPWSVEPSSLVALFVSLGIMLCTKLLLFLIRGAIFFARLLVVEKAH